MTPTFETIESGELRHLAAAVLLHQERSPRRDPGHGGAFIKEYTSADAMGENGYLSERGLVPLSPKKRKQVRDAALNGKEFAPAGS